MDEIPHITVSGAAGPSRGIPPQQSRNLPPPTGNNTRNASARGIRSWEAKERRAKLRSEKRNIARQQTRNEKRNNPAEKRVATGPPTEPTEDQHFQISELPAGTAQEACNQSTPKQESTRKPKIPFKPKAILQIATLSIRTTQPDAITLTENG